RWPEVRPALIREIDRSFGAFEGDRFCAARWGTYLRREGIDWPRLPSGALALDKRTFKERSLAHPQLEPMRQLRKTLSHMRKLGNLAVGPDGRNRCLLSAFQSKTGRNQPSNTHFIFGRPKWLRGLIKPTRDRAVAYIDYEQQEFGIAAAL